MTAESEKRSQHTVEFLTGTEVQQLDDDPVLERRDIWRGDQP